MKTLKTALSVILVLCMVMSLGGITAFADLDVVTSDEGTGNQLGILEGEATISYTDSSGGGQGLTIDSGTGVPSSGPGTVKNNYNTGDVQSSAPSSEAAISSNILVCNEAPAGTFVEIGGVHSDIERASATHPTPGEYSAGEGKVTVNVTETATEYQINGTIDASGTEADGLTVQNYAGSTATTVEVIGNVTGGTNPVISNGVYVFNQSGAGDLTVKVDGDVSTGNNTENNSGISSVSNGGNITIEVNGSVTGGEGIDAWQNNEHGIMNITVTDDVTADHQGITSYSDGGNITIAVNGNVTGSKGIDASRGGNAGGSTNITVAGDVTAKSESHYDYGIDVYTTGDKINITVGTAEDGGTVTGGIRVPNVSETTTNLTLFETKADEIEGQDSVIKSVINYIVRLIQPKEEEGSLSVTTEKSNTVKDINGKDMTVATEEEKITLDITAKDGYEVDGAFIGEGENKEALEKDEDGKFFYRVKRGGAILLSALFKKNAEPEPEPEPQPEPEPKPEPKPQPDPAITVSYADVKVTFDLDGGTLDGKTGTLTKWYFAGQTIKLPEAPTKEGFTFAGWETTVKGEKVVLQPGEEFTVTGAQSFTALWTEA